jgi:hypothetical protein
VTGSGRLDMNLPSHRETSNAGVRGDPYMLRRPPRNETHRFTGLLDPLPAGMPMCARRPAHPAGCKYSTKVATWRCPMPASR